MEQTWLVIVPDAEIGGSVVFHVKQVPSALMARQAIQKEYERQGWGKLDLDLLVAYRLPQFRGRHIAQIGTVYPPAAAKERLSTKRGASHERCGPFGREHGEACK
jgi:hypothetical protein